MNHIVLFPKDYTVLDLLGKGGFACVYRAKCKNSGVEVAIKMVSFNLKFLHPVNTLGNTPWSLSQTVISV